eukprot:4656705-Heterocapsa_arctica.AAC.1
MAKATTGLIKQQVAAKLEKLMGATQFGGAKGGGTDYPNHTVRTAMRVAKSCMWSIFVMFLDLEKAYDK